MNNRRLDPRLDPRLNPYLTLKELNTPLDPRYEMLPCGRSRRQVELLNQAKGEKRMTYEDFMNTISGKSKRMVEQIPYHLSRAHINAVTSKAPNNTKILSSKAPSRKGPYNSYSRDQIIELLQYYFIHRMTVREACKKCQMNKSSGYYYVRLVKNSQYAKFLNTAYGLTKEDLITKLIQQFDALKISKS